MPDSSMTVLAEGLAVQRNQIPDYAFEGFNEAIRIWKVWERKNLLPYPGTWAEQPANVWDFLEIFDEVHDAHVRQEAEMAEMQRKLKRH